MKKLNKKGFTLIELLAVIIILAILIAVAVPSVTRYLDGARKDTFVTNAKAAIKAAKLDYDTGHENAEIITMDYGPLVYTVYKYNLKTINKLLEKQLNESPYNKDYQEGSAVYIVNASINGNAQENLGKIGICLLDKNGNGVSGVGELNIDVNDSSSFGEDNYKIWNSNSGTMRSALDEEKITKDRIIKGYVNLHC